MQGRDNPRLAQPEGMEFRCERFLPDRVDLVRHHQEGLSGRPKLAGEHLVLLGDSRLRVDHQKDEAGGFHRRRGLRPHRLLDPPGSTGKPTGVDEGYRSIAPVNLHLHPVAGHAGRFVGDGQASPRKAVHQRGFAHVGSPDHGDLRLPGQAQPPAPRPLDPPASWMIRRASSNISSRVSLVVSRTWASSAGTKGFVLASRESLLATPASTPSPPLSRCRRPALIPGSADRKIFTSASGNTTVPMSLPSITQPPLPRERCSRRITERTSG